MRVKVSRIELIRMDILWTFIVKLVGLGQITLIQIRIGELLLMEIEAVKGKRVCVSCCNLWTIVQMMILIVLDSVYCVA